MGYVLLDVRQVTDFCDSLQQRLEFVPAKLLHDRLATLPARA
jgi:hypothetical protein